MRGAAALSGVAVVATGLAVSSGVVTETSLPFGDAAAALPAPAAAHQLSAEELAERESRVSRSAVSRTTEVDARADSLKVARLSNQTGRARTQTEDLTVADPKTLTRALMSKYGLDPADVSCVDNIWTQESNWDIHADNPTSSAYGIPQSLPGSKMASAGPNWEHSAETQIRWGLGYIKASYGTPCGALGAWQSRYPHWY